MKRLVLFACLLLACERTDAPQAAVTLAAGLRGVDAKTLHAECVIQRGDSDKGRENGWICVVVGEGVKPVTLFCGTGWGDGCQIHSTQMCVFPPPATK